MNVPALNFDRVQARVQDTVNLLVGIMIGEYEKCPCCGRFMKSDRTMLRKEDYIIYTCKKCGRMKETFLDVSDEEIAWGCGIDFEFIDDEDPNS